MLPAAWAFVIAVVCSCVLRVLHVSRIRFLGPTTRPPAVDSYLPTATGGAFVERRRRGGERKVIMEDRACGDWKARMWDVASRRGFEDVRICLLLTCRDMTDVALCTLEPEAAAFAAVKCRKERDACGQSRHTVCRLVRHFVTGEEAWVAVIHPHVRLVDQWDVVLEESLGHLLSSVPENASPPSLLSVPVSGTVPCFPCLDWDTRDGTSVVRRERSHAFPPQRENAMAVRTVPSVACCLEFVAGSPEQLRACFPPRRARDGGSESADGPLLLSRTHVVPTAAIVEADASLESRLLDMDGVSRDSLVPPSSVCKGWRVGLTCASSASEKIDKYGSTANANLSLKFGPR